MKRMSRSTYCKRRDIVHVLISIMLLICLGLCQSMGAPAHNSERVMPTRAGGVTNHGDQTKFAVHAKWSLDGKQIAILCRSSQGMQLYMRPSHGTHWSYVSNLGTWDLMDFIWSGDSRHVLFCKCCDVKGNPVHWQLLSLDIVTRDKKVIASNLPNPAFSLSPNRRIVAFIRKGAKLEPFCKEFPAYDDEVWSYNLVTKRESLLGKGLQTMGNDLEWSPDSRMIALTGSPSKITTDETYSVLFGEGLLIVKDGGSKQVVSNPKYPVHPRSELQWTRNGTIRFISREHYRGAQHQFLREVRLSDGKVTKLFDFGDTSIRGLFQDAKWSKNGAGLISFVGGSKGLTTLYWFSSDRHKWEKIWVGSWVRADWSPDGTRALICANGRVVIWKPGSKYTMNLFPSSR